MLDKVINLYKTKPVIFWIFAIILVPIVLLLVFKDFALSFLAAKANETTQEAKRKDEALKTAINSLSAQAAVEKQKADDLGKQAADVEVGTDWNKS